MTKTPNRYQKIADILARINNLSDDQQRARLSKDLVDRLTVEEMLMLAFVTSKPIPDEEMAFLAEMIFSLYESLGIDLDRALKDQPEAQKKMETLAPLMKEYGAIVKKIYKAWNDSATEKVEEDPWA